MIILLAFSMFSIYKIGTVAQESEMRFNATEATGQDWENWPMFHRDAQRTGRASGAGIITDATTFQWAYPPLGQQPIGAVCGSPVVGDDGTIYFGSTDKNLYAINPDGTLKCQFTTTTDGKITSSPAISSPGSIYPGRVYIGTHEQDPNEHNFFAVKKVVVDTVICSEIWSLQVPTPPNRPDGSPVTNPYAIMAGSSPLIVTDPINGEPVIYIGAADGYLYCIRDHGTYGEVVWGTQLQPSDLLHGFHCSPAMSPAGLIGVLGTIYCGGVDPADNQGKLFALDPYNGNIIWSIVLATTGGEGVSSPSVEIVNGAETIFAGTSDRQMRAVAVIGGAPVLAAGNYGTTAGISSCPAIYDLNGDGKVEVIFGEASGEVHAITYDHTLPMGSRWDPNSPGSWTYQTACSLIGSSAAVALAPQPTVFIGGCLPSGIICSINWDGTLLGSYTTQTPELCISSSPAVAQQPTDLVGAPGWVFIGSLNNPLSPTIGRLYAFGPPPSSKFIAHFMTPEGEPYPFDVIISDGIWRQEFKNLTYIETEVPCNATYTFIYEKHSYQSAYEIGVRIQYSFSPGEIRHFKVYTLPNLEEMEFRIRPYIFIEEADANASLSWEWNEANNTLSWNVSIEAGRHMVSGVMFSSEQDGYAIVAAAAEPCVPIENHITSPEDLECEQCAGHWYPGRLMNHATFAKIEPNLGTVRIENVLYNDNKLLYPFSTTLQTINGMVYGEQFIDPQYAVAPDNYILSVKDMPEDYASLRFSLNVTAGRKLYIEVFSPKIPSLEVFTFSIAAENIFAESSYSGLTHNTTDKTITVDVSTETDYDWWGCLVLPKNLTVRTLTAYLGNTSYQLSKFYNYIENFVDDYNIITVRIPPEMDGLDCTYTVFGDINGDGTVNIMDIATVAKAYGSYPGHLRWDPVCDINYDFKVNILDIASIAKQFGKTDC